MTWSERCHFTNVALEDGPDAILLFSSILDRAKTKGEARGAIKGAAERRSVLYGHFCNRLLPYLRQQRSLLFREKLFVGLVSLADGFVPGLSRFGRCIRGTADVVRPGLRGPDGAGDCNV